MKYSSFLLLSLTVTSNSRLSWQQTNWRQSSPLICRGSSPPSLGKEHCCFKLQKENKKPQQQQQNPRNLTTRINLIKLPQACSGNHLSPWHRGSSIAAAAIHTHVKSLTGPFLPLQSDSRGRPGSALRLWAEQSCVPGCDAALQAGQLPEWPLQP